MTRGLRFLILLGTDHHQFARAVAWADARQRAFPEDEVLIQHGRTAPPQVAQGIDFLTSDELRTAVAEADVVITHGGPGTISDARAGGHRPILFPRNPDLGEHVDDHQQRFAPWCAARGLVLLARNPAELDALVAELPETGTRRNETRLDTVGRSVGTFAELVDGPAVDRRRIVVPDSPRILHLIGDARMVAAAEERLALRPGTLVMGAVTRDWSRGASGDVVCACGLGIAECGFWSEVGLRAFDGWHRVDLARLETMTSRVSRPVRGRAVRRHPGRKARERLLAVAGLHRAVLGSAREAAGASLLVTRGDVATALVLSHDRRLDLRVADLGAGRVARWALRHRGVVVTAWPDPALPQWVDAEAAAIGDWAPARPLSVLHSPLVALGTGQVGVPLRPATAPAAQGAHQLGQPQGHPEAVQQRQVDHAAGENEGHLTPDGIPARRPRHE